MQHSNKNMTMKISKSKYKRNTSSCSEAVCQCQLEYPHHAASLPQHLALYSQATSALTIVECHCVSTLTIVKRAALGILHDQTDIFRLCAGADQLHNIGVADPLQLVELVQERPLLLLRLHLLHGDGPVPPDALLDHAERATTHTLAWRGAVGISVVPSWHTGLSCHLLPTGV